MRAAIIVMSCLLPGGAEDFESPTQMGIGETWLAGTDRPYYFARRAQRRGASSDRAAASTRPSIKVCLELLSDNAAAGREAEEMLKTGCQYVSVSVTLGLVRNGSSPPMMLTSRV